MIRENVCYVLDGKTKTLNEAIQLISKIYPFQARQAGVSLLLFCY